MTGASAFFVVTNFSVWILPGPFGVRLYPLTLAGNRVAACFHQVMISNPTLTVHFVYDIGLWQCYTEALPFFRPTIVSDLIFTPVFFTIVPIWHQFYDDLISNMESQATETVIEDTDTRLELAGIDVERAAPVDQPIVIESERVAMLLEGDEKFNADATDEERNGDATDEEDIKQSSVSVPDSLLKTMPERPLPSPSESKSFPAVNTSEVPAPGPDTAKDASDQPARWKYRWTSPLSFQNVTFFFIVTMALMVATCPKVTLASPVVKMNIVVDGNRLQFL